MTANAGNPTLSASASAEPVPITDTMSIPGAT
jgi:hypothetical protein